MVAESEPRTDVLITVDTEVSTPLYDKWQLRQLDREVRRDIYGETTHGQFGLLYQLQMLRKYDLRATYFVDPFFSAITGSSVLAQLVEQVLLFGQEVQLHIHTEWLPYMADSPLGKRTGYSINRFSREEQAVLLDKAKGMLISAGVADVCAFRAGNWGANNDTLAALASVGIGIDFSYNSAHNECKIGLAKSHGYASRMQEGVLEMPLTVFRDGLNRPRPLQLTAASFSESKDILFDAHRSGVTGVVFCTHTMELIRAKQWPVRPEWIVVRRFERLCRFLSENRSRFQTVTCSDIRNGSTTIKPSDNLLVPLLRARQLSTIRRLIGQAKRRIW